MAELNSAGSNEKVMAQAVFHEILKGRNRIPAVRNEDNFKGRPTPFGPEMYW